MLLKQTLLILIILTFATSVNAQNKMTIYRSKIELYRYSKHFDSSKIYFQKALPLALKANDSLAVFYIYKFMGDAYEHHIMPDSTLYMYDFCEKYIPNKNDNLRSFLLNDRAYTYNLLNDYEHSTKLTLKALKIAEKSGDNTLISSISITLADNFAKLKMNKQAEKYYTNAISLIKNDFNSPTLQQAYRYYGVFFLENKKIDKAFDNLKKANKIAISIKDSISMAYNWYYLSDCYWQKKQIDSCFIVAKKAENIWESRAENIDLAMVCRQQGAYYLELKQYNKAEFYLKKAEKYIVGDLYFQEKLLTNLSDLYYKKGNTDKAYSYLLKAKKIIETIKDNENKSKVTNLTIKYEADKKEILLQKQQKINDLEVLKSQRKNSQLTIIMLVTGLLLLTLSVIVLSYLKMQRQNKLLFASNEKLESLFNQKRILLKEIHHRVKNNLTTLKSLLFLQAKATENIEVKTILKECQLRIQSMALIHQSLYEDVESDHVNFYVFLEQLFESLEESFKNEEKNIRISIEKNEVILDISKAIFLGLVLNELVTNSYKYAFVNKNEGEIKIRLSKIDNDLEVIYSDNGSGLPNGFHEKEGGFGFKIIQILVQQINAKLFYEYENGLSTFKITMKNAY